jgi:tRNA(fMet)-specific endonuclease VapC
MSLYILDTDTLSLHERGHPTVKPAVEAHLKAGTLAITVISIEEQLSGWYTLVRQARQPPDLALAYTRLAQIVEQLAGIPILPFTEPAIARYEALKALRLTGYPERNRPDYATFFLLFGYLNFGSRFSVLGLRRRSIW